MDTELSTLIYAILGWAILNNIMPSEREFEVSVVKQIQRDSESETLPSVNNGTSG